MKEQATGKRVAVIGLGLTGVTCVKNLLETGFAPTGFEQNDYVGGLWKWSSDVMQTTVLKGGHATYTNNSSMRNCYTDFVRLYRCVLPYTIANHNSHIRMARPHIRVERKLHSILMITPPISMSSRIVASALPYFD